MLIPTLRRDDEENLDGDDERAKLLATDAPHETAAVLRAFRAGLLGPDLMKAVAMSARQTKDSIALAIEEEGEAARLGRKIHDARVPRTMQ